MLEWQNAYRERVRVSDSIIAELQRPTSRLLRCEKEAILLLAPKFILNDNFKFFFNL